MSTVLHHLVSASAERAPDSVALVDGGRSLTYEELDAESGRMSQLLAASGVRPGDRVGIHADKSIEAIVGLYGAMKAGAAYVPLDPNAPAARTAHIANDCAITVLVSPTKLGPRWRSIVDEGAKLEHLVVPDAAGSSLTNLKSPAGVTLHGADAIAANEPTTAARAIDDDLSYILYTSGSTGVPKGVMVSHRNAVSFASWAATEFSFRPEDRITQLAPLIFDLSTLDLFASAMAGSAVHLIASKATMFPAQLRSYIEDNEMTAMYAVPSLLTMLVERGKLAEGAMPSLRLILFAGEVFPTRHLSRLMGLVPHAEYANLYGPTETNACTFHRVTTRPAETDPPTSIGKAIPCDQAIIVGDDGAVVRSGDVGELFIRGATVMQGYWGDPERSAATLVAPPGVAGPREPAYRTGDLVREELDGTLTFLGRRDSQIKRQGYRIELGDIESAIMRHPDVVECAVSAIDDGADGLRLIAHVAVKNELDARSLQKACSAHLPRYMMPDELDLRPELPKTPTEKIDRALLARHAEEQRGS